MMWEKIGVIRCPDAPFSVSLSHSLGLSDTASKEKSVHKTHLIRYTNGSPQQVKLLLILYF